MKYFQVRADKGLSELDLVSPNKCFTLETQKPIDVQTLQKLARPPRRRRHTLHPPPSFVSTQLVTTFDDVNTKLPRGDDPAYVPSARTCRVCQVVVSPATSCSWVLGASAWVDTSAYRRHRGACRRRHGPGSSLRAVLAGRNRGKRSECPSPAC